MHFRFEKLDVWQKAVDFADQIYRITKGFPADERFGLTNQMRRAAVSISSNIAEGISRSSDRDKSRFIEIAYGSVMEIVSQSHVAKRQGFISEVDFEQNCQIADDLARMLSGFRNRLQGNSDSNH